MKTVYSKEVRDKYDDQKWMAKCRGIEFKLTIDQWVNWWEANLGDDWLKKRGCKSGQYVMARIGDKGPYALGNIECITSNQNHKDAKKVCGEDVGGARLRARDVRMIFLSEPHKEHILAEHFNIRMQYIALIKRRRFWGEITKDLGDPEIKGYGRGESHPLAKLTENEVRSIFLAKGSYSAIAKRFGTRTGRVQSIKSGDSWRSVTKDLGPIVLKRGRRGPYKKSSKT